MAENPLDKLFRDKLAKRTFVYDDALWEEAAKGMERASADKAHKPLWNFLFSFFISGFIVTAVWFMDINLKSGHSHGLRHLGNEMAELNDIDTDIRANNRDTINISAKPESFLGQLDGNLEKESNPSPPLDHKEEIHENSTPGSNAPRENQDLYRMTEDDRSIPEKNVSSSDLTEHLATQYLESEKETKYNQSDQPVTDPESEPALVIQEESDTNDQEDGTSEISSTASPENKISPKYKIGVSGFGGFMLSNLSLQSNSNTAGDYIDQRKSSTRNMVSAETGILVNAFYQSWSLTSGSIFARHTESTGYKFDITTLIIDSTRFNILDSIIIRIDSNAGRYDTIWQFMPADTVIYDSAMSVRRDSVQEGLNGKVSYRYVEVPLMIGKSFPMGNRGQLYLRSGISVGILRSVSGYQLDPVSQKMERLRFESYNKLFYFALLNAGVSYEILPSVSLFIEGATRWNISHVRTSSGFNERLNAYGGRIGIDYRF